MASVNEKMTALANEVRELSGTTGALSIDGMTSVINTENTNFSSNLSAQDVLITQIQTALQNKAASSGGTNTDDATATAADLLSGKTAYAKGEKITGTIATKTASDLTASGATVTVPPGYYASQATKSISTGKAATPATTITKNPTISVSSAGKITASVSGTQSVTPTITTGYILNGTGVAGTITVSGSATKQLTTKAASTYTPSTSNQTIPSDTYLTGVQTIKGDPNLIGGNIKSGVSIFGVVGSYTGSGGGSGGSAEGCVLELLTDAPVGEELITLYSVDPEGQITVTTIDGFDLMLGISIVCLKNSLVYSTVPFFSTMSAVSNTIQRIDGQCIFITGDGTYLLQ